MDISHWKNDRNRIAKRASFPRALPPKIAKKTREYCEINNERLNKNHCLRRIISHPGDRSVIFWRWWASRCLFQIYKPKSRRFSTSKFMNFGLLWYPEVLLFVLLFSSLPIEDCIIWLIFRIRYILCLRTFCTFSDWAKTLHVRGEFQLLHTDITTIKLDDPLLD